MEYDPEKAHGVPAELHGAQSDKLQRPLTADEKLAATTVDVDSRGSSSSRVIEYNSTPVKQNNGMLNRSTDDF